MTRRIARFKLLDAWRGIAALLIVLFHSAEFDLRTITQGPDVPIWQRLTAKLVSFGDVGVIIFFVISGYCISASIVSHSKSIGIGSAKLFFLRRFWRIYPTYWLAFLCLCCIDFVLVSFGANSMGPYDALMRVSLPQLIANLTLIETWRPLIHWQEKLMIMPIAWSLCYEEQFYLIMGLISIAGRAFFAVLAGLSLFVLLFHFWQAMVGGFISNGLFLDGYWLHFALGVLVYYVLHVSRRPLYLWKLVFTLICGSSLILNHYVPTGLFIYLAFSALAGLAFVTMYSDDERLSGARFIKPLFYCGECSYSLYLLHAQVCALTIRVINPDSQLSFFKVLLFQVPLCALFSVFAARMFYLTVERRFIRIGATFKR